ncbi:hypothetical protein [Occallatibacter savannae]|uniref:hypothetical protein n=1 Tax=Occallatibacter savannae TaxID=1002691 RepID=UPI000D690A8F|nr:hypothetical protein [Occallatibacter savannae]
MSFINFTPISGQMFLIVDAVILLSVVVSQEFLLTAGRRWWSVALFALCWSVIVVATTAQSATTVLR